MAIPSPTPRHRRQSSSTPVGPIGAALAVLAACGLVFGCPAQPVGGGGGGGGPAGHTAPFSTGLGQAYVQAASVHEALVQGNYDGARKLLDPLMRQLAATRARARVDEQRQILRIEDRGLQLAGMIDQKAVGATKASQELMEAVVAHQTAALKPRTAPGPQAAVKAPGVAKAKVAAAKKVTAAKKPVVAGKATPLTARRAASVRSAAAWPVKPQPARKGGKAPDPNLARVGLARAVVGAIHAEQALLHGRMDVALGHVKGLRGALRQAQTKGTPWQKKALTRLDKQANQLQFQLTHHNASAFGAASQLVDASLKVQQSFKLASAKPGGGGGTPRAGAKPAAKPVGKPKAGKPKPGKPSKAKPGKPSKAKPKPKPQAKPGPKPTPFMQDVPNRPVDPTMDEDHPGALPKP
ncbi:MAG: hypothetical protein JWM80_1313 [Cyanobacteria bacterium RYN_339]|nr:hypothetical protein [Cyanobacteria bacterium RYN_339]